MNPREKAQAVERVLEHMDRAGLTADDLIQFGGEDLRDKRRANKARRVEVCWGLMARLADFGGTPLVLSPADFGKFIAQETDKWGKVIRAANIKPD